MKYRTIVADPPWPVDNIRGRVRPARRDWQLPYSTMTLGELKALPVKQMADSEGCHLYLWTTHRWLPSAFSVMEAWGGRYECLMTWVKPTGVTPFSWMYNTEHVLFGRVGTLPVERKGLKLSFASMGRLPHSAKPDSFYDMVEMASPEPRLELFSRRSRLSGWDYWGDESLQTVELEAS